MTMKAPAIEGRGPSRGDERCLLPVRVQPGASRNGIKRAADGRFRISVTAKAQDGEANQALVGFVAALLGCPRSHVAIVAGEHARDKILSIKGFHQGEVEQMLAGKA